MTEPPSETPDSARLVGVTLDEHTVVRRNPDVEHERAVAIYDLLEENLFRPCSGVCGPFRLHLAVQENRLLFDIRSESGAPVETVSLPLGSFRTVVRDYFLICESYYDAIRKLTPSQIEAIDMGRRGLHNEGADLLRDRLAGKVDIDRNTARRLFTLVCVLHLR